MSPVTGVVYGKPQFKREICIPQKSDETMTITHSVWERKQTAFPPPDSAVWQDEYTQWNLWGLEER